MFAECVDNRAGNDIIFSDGRISHIRRDSVGRRRGRPIVDRLFIQNGKQTGNAFGHFDASQNINQTPPAAVNIFAPLRIFEPRQQSLDDIFIVRVNHLRQIANQAQLEPTQRMLSELLGMSLTGESDGRSRFTMPGDGPGALVDVAAETRRRGRQAGGTVHHVAFRAPDAATQLRWRQELLDAGVHVTEVIDRQYFTAIYFHEPGGVLFEIATDQPGFTVDEPLLTLGRHLKLPPWLEPSREQIARALPILRVPGDDDGDDHGDPA